MLKCELHHVEVCLLEGTDLQHATDIATAMQSLGQTRLMTGQEHSDRLASDAALKVAKESEPRRPRQW